MNGPARLARRRARGCCALLRGMQAGPLHRERPCVPQFSCAQQLVPETRTLGAPRAAVAQSAAHPQLAAPIARRLCKPSANEAPGEPRGPASPSGGRTVRRQPGQASALPRPACCTRHPEACESLLLQGKARARLGAAALLAAALLAATAEARQSDLWGLKGEKWTPEGPLMDFSYAGEAREGAQPAASAAGGGRRRPAGPQGGNVQCSPGEGEEREERGAACMAGPAVWARLWAPTRVGHGLFTGPHSHCRL